MGSLLGKEFAFLEMEGSMQVSFSMDKPAVIMASIFFLMAHYIEGAFVTVYLMVMVD